MPIVPSTRPRRGAAPAVTRLSRRLSRSSFLIAETLLTELHRGRSKQPDTPAARADRLSWTARNLCALHGIEVHTSGIVPTAPVVLVANHVSYVDPLAVLSALPASAVAKREVADWPVLGTVMSSLGVLFVERDCAYSGARVLRESARLLDQGVSVLAFPEGTTTTGRDVLPFRRGLFGVASHTGVPVVPVSLRYDDPEAPWVGDQLFVPHYLQTTARPVTRVRVHFHDPIFGDALSAQCLANAAREVVQRALAVY